MENYLPYNKQSLSSEDIAAVGKALQRDLITRGPKVEAFEKAFAEYCGARFAVAFSNGTSALMAAYAAAKVGPNDRVLTTPNTFVATASAAALRGATPVFIDIDRATGNLDLELLEVNLKLPVSRGKRVIVPVHFAGIPVAMERVDRMIDDPETVVIEDAAHAVGSCYADGQKVGCCAWSQMTMFSFHPVKNMTTGEGGMVTTNDEELFRRLCLYRNNGIERNPERCGRYDGPWYYEVQQMSGNFNLTDFQAALGISQLKRLDGFALKRRELMALYRELLAKTEHIRLFTAEHDDKTAFHLFVVQIDFEAWGGSREELVRRLMEKGIGAQVHYIPVYQHPIFRKEAGDLAEYFPEMEAYYSQALSLPLYYDLTTDDVRRVVSEFQNILTHKPELELSQR